MKSWERVKDVVEEAPDIIIHSAGSHNWHQASFYLGHWLRLPILKRERKKERKTWDPTFRDN